MPIFLTPIPAEVPITERGKVSGVEGIITNFFRQAWQRLVDVANIVGCQALVQQAGQTAAIGATAAYVATAPATFRVSWYFRKTIADGVASSLQMTIGWTDKGAALTAVGVALATDTATANQSGSFLVRADVNTAITYAVAYASTTPNKMTYDVVVTVEQTQ